MSTELSQGEILRYSRHLMIPEVGLEGQRKLKSASVLVVGTGGLGSPVLLYLAAAGVGRIGVVDYDIVETSNLQRQVIHGSSSLEKPKVESARQRMLEINPYIQVNTYNEVFSSENALSLSAPYKILVDASDNFPTRYLVNDVAVLTGKSDVYGSVYRFEGQASVFDARCGPCYRCLFPEPPPPGMAPSCAEAGVFGVLPGVIGALQATEVIKLILGVGEVMTGKLLLYDALDSTFQVVNLRKNPKCKICSPQPEIDHLLDYEQFCGIPANDHLEKILTTEWEISPVEVAQKLHNGTAIRLVDVREPVEQQISRLPGTVSIPYGELASRLDELDPEEEIILFCRTGVRSGRVLQLLLAAGYRKVKNMRGGINAWADEVDPGMMRY